MTPADIAVALIRTTLAASAAALAAWALLAWLRIDSPRIHRTAWLLVIAQGWLFVPLTIEIETSSPPSATKRAAGLVPAGIHEEEAIEFENGSQWGRGPFATVGLPPMESRQSQKVPDPLPLAIAAWLLGASLIVVIAAYRYMRVLRTLPLGAPPDEPTWQAEWRSALAAAKLRRRQTVDLRITASLGPLLHWAPWSYLILVPRELWSALASPERQAILRHELAHLRRRDLWKSLAIRVLSLPQWFNPLVWFAVRRFDEAAEWACDDAAAATNAGRLTFAASLLQSAEYAAAPFPASAPAARGVLTRRIHRLVSPRFKEESKMKLLVPPLLLLLLATFQTIRIERTVAAQTPQQPSFEDWSVSGPFYIPLGQRIKHAVQRHEELLLLAERQRQLDFDRLTKEFEDFARKDYVIDPPDILLIESDKLLPKGPHRLETFDELQIHVNGALAEQQIDSVCNVDADGAVDLGATYGRINVVGQTIKQAEDSIRAQLVTVLGRADVSVSLRASSSAQAITGQHLVAMDGRVNLGVYGMVYVAGMTLKEARAAIELKLAEQLDDPKVSVDVLAYNSKVVYLILQGGGSGDDVVRMPLKYPYTLAMNVGALLKDATYPNPIDFAAAKIYIARPAANGVDVELKLPVAWDAARGEPTATTNYPLLPGDRIFVTTSEKRGPRAVRPTPVADPPPSPVVPATAVDESSFDKRARHSEKAVTLTLAVIEDATDSLTEFRTGEGDMIMADGKTLGAALRVLEKNSLVKFTSRERVVCAYGKNEPIGVKLPIPNPTLKLKSRQSEATEVSVRALGKSTFAVKLEFQRKVEGQDVRESLELAMRSGESNILECTGAATDGPQPKTKTYLLIGLSTTTDDDEASIESLRERHRYYNPVRY